jgi:hypothetical protein
MTWHLERIDDTAETSAALRRQAQSFLRLAQRGWPVAVVAELLALVACLEERATSVGSDESQSDVQRAMLRILV